MFVSNDMNDVKEALEIHAVVQRGDRPNELEYADFVAKYRLIWSLLMDGRFDETAFRQYAAADRMSGRDGAYMAALMTAETFPAVEAIQAHRATLRRPRPSHFSQWGWFISRYPTVARLLIDNNRFSPTALKHYIKCWAAAMPTSHVQCVKIESEYLKALLKTEKCDVRQINEQVATFIADLTRKPPRAPAEQVPGEISARDVASEMWAFYRRKAKSPEWLARKYEERQIDFRVEGYSDFMAKYTTVSRKLIDHGEFSMRAFERYLDRLSRVGYQSYDGKWEREADYMLYLWRELNPHGDVEVGKRIWQQTKKDLKKEADSFKEDYAKADAKAKENLKTSTDSTRQDLLRMASRDPAFRERLLQALQERKAPSAVASGPPA